MSHDDFSICDQCLGKDQLLRLVKHCNAAECRTCTRPFDVYRWNARTAGEQAKKTIICVTCARQRDCCQLCMLDIHFHIPLNLRDTALRMAGLDDEYSITKTKNRELQAIHAEEAQTRFANCESIASERQAKARALLAKLSTKLTSQSAVAPKSTSRRSQENAAQSEDISHIVKKLPFTALLDSEKYPDLTSLFVFGAFEKCPQYVLTNWFQLFGAVKAFTINHTAKCAFVTYTARDLALAFANAVLRDKLNKSSGTAGLVLVDNKYAVRVAWGKPAPLGRTNAEHRRIGVVVDKAMKQLADKDKSAGKAPEKTGPTPKVHQSSTVGQSKRAAGPTPPHKSGGYASLDPDFEA